MSKVKKEIVQAALMDMLGKIIETMPSTTHKFILGGASSFIALKGGKFIENMLGFVSDEEGYVDVEQMKSVLDGAFKASNDKLQIELFTPQTTGLLSMFVKPVTLTLTRKDMDDLISVIQSQAIPEVQLSK